MADTVSVCANCGSHDIVECSGDPAPDSVPAGADLVWQPVWLPTYLRTNDSYPCSVLQPSNNNWNEWRFVYGSAE